MHHELPVDDRIENLVGDLQGAGFETYIVGGAIRDLLLGRIPKDYDISTAATPEEIVAVFGRRRARIIGKRFRLVHVRCGEDLVEVSTFRCAPQLEKQTVKNPKRELPENLIVNDNDFGSSEEDALRRDFTVNALYYDPEAQELIDFTGHGIEDIEKGVIRAIGDPSLRFAEDPVRMLRALKLVGQYDFSLDGPTETALFASLDLIKNASESRLSLELEKVLSSAYGDKHLITFHDYGFLGSFLPFFEQNWNTDEMALALDLLNERNLRVQEGIYRNSISLAMATLLFPFVEHDLMIEGAPPAQVIITDLSGVVFKPQNMVNRLILSAERIVEMEFDLLGFHEAGNLINQPGYAHARELMMILNEVRLHEDDLHKRFPAAFVNNSGFRRNNNNRYKPNRRR